MRRWTAKAAAIGGLVLVLVCVAVYEYARRSLPEIDATISVPGLSSRVDIVRDPDAIPHIFAATEHDALFGLGYVHAQDRLWQMEFQRRIGNGRLSEIFGAATIPQDRFLRVVGFARAARTAWDHLPEPAKENVNAYVAGVNAFLATHRGSRLPPEFSILRIVPETWTGVDVLVWGKMMAWDLGGNYALELLRDDLVRAVGIARMRQLMPPPTSRLSILPDAWDPPIPFREASSAGRPHSKDTGDGPIQAPAHADTSASSFDALGAALSDGEKTVRDLLRGAGGVEGLGSNNWVVDGTLTATGKPLLANDPHLTAKVPSTWYLAHISGGALDVIGATLPGTPVVVIGRNRSIAWGVTNMGADVEDLYREQLDERGTAAMFRGHLEPLAVVPEIINVKGAPPIRVDVRITRHGPLVSDAVNADNREPKRDPRPAPLEPLALRWTGLDQEDATLAAFLEVNKARNWTEFTTALRGLVAPSQNFVYADTAGHIGYYAPGRIPVRARGDGSLPSDGASGDEEWTGWIPFDQLPHLYDPANHIIITANQRPAPPAYPYTLGVDWPEPYRAARISELLRTTHGFTTEAFARIQADTVSLHARAVLPVLLPHVHPADANDQRALDLVRRWDMDAGAASGAAGIFEAWFLELTRAIVADDLGPRTTDAYLGRFSVVTRFLINVLTSNDGSWCDDRRTAQRETCDDVVTTALHAATADLTARLGSDMTRWRWDAAHRAIFPHQGLDAVKILRPLLSRSMPHGGDWSTVDVGAVAVEQPFEQHAVPGYREIIDLSPANDSRYLIDVGQSGHPLSKHYDDFLQDWDAVKHRRMRMERGQIENDAIGHMTLRPE